MNEAVTSEATTDDSSMNVLVVDDDASTRMMARAFLTRAGFTVEEAGDGAEALERVDASRPDLIMLDVDMPVLDGFDTCARLREREHLHGVPVLMLTGLDNDEAISRAYEAGATDFASKPINWSLLCHRLRYMLRASQSARELGKSRAGLSAAQRIARLGDWELDPASGRMRWSDELYRILGRTRAEEAPTLAEFTALIRESDRTRFAAAIDESVGGSGRASLDVTLCVDDRTERHARQDIERVDEGEGVGPRLRGVVQDFTERRDTERRIQQLAFFDALTGLPNRVRFTDTLTRAAAVAVADTGESALAVLFLDIDDFKRVNDTLGHETGDALLKEVARRLSTLARARGVGEVRVTAARMGGDEFTLMVRGLGDVGELHGLAEELVRIFDDSFEIRGQTLTMIFPSGDGHLNKRY